ncbi:MAG: CsgG/HfaB family protein [Alphaproteobacteria bacterium]
MKKLLFALFLLTSFVVNAKEVMVTATGSGKTRDFAIMDAVENAVRQTTEITVERDKAFQQLDIKASGEYTRQKSDIRSRSTEEDGKVVSGSKSQRDNLDSHKITANLENNSKEILAKYKGSVQSYQIVKEEQKDNLVYVTINAIVIKEDVYDSHDYKSKGLVKKADYSLAVLPFKATKQLNCLGKKVSIDELNTLITNAFVEKLAPSRKFNLVDRNNLDNYASELALITDDMTLPENKIKLKNIVSADYILVGTIENFTATSKKEYLELTGETNYESSSKLKLSYRILETATMEIISAGSVEKKFSKDDAFSSCYNVEELLINRAIAEACEKLLTDIFPDYKPVKQEAKNSTTKTAKPAKPVDYSLQLD